MLTEKIKLLLSARYSVDPLTGCWTWHGTIDRDGYGKIKIRAIRVAALRAHRVSYEAYVGPIPDDLQIDHLCRNRACVNPAHLEPVTCKENIDRSPRAMKTACHRGHEFTAENTYFMRQGKYRLRRCRKCQVIYSARNREQRIGA
jgi:hypothetical protein